MAVATVKFIFLIVCLLVPCYGEVLQSPQNSKTFLPFGESSGVQKAKDKNDPTSTIKLSIHISCFHCIRNVFKHLDTKECNNIGACGPFRITSRYWAIGGGRTLPGKSDRRYGFTSCAKDDFCAMRTIQTFMEKHAKDCNNDGIIDCHDMIRLHKSGDGTCGNPLDQSEETTFNTCLNEHFPENSEQQKISHIAVSGSSDPGVKQAQNNPLRLTVGHQGIHIECFKCMCEAYGCKRDGLCSISGSNCGLFYITPKYWSNGGSRTVSGISSDDRRAFSKCTTDLICALETIQDVMDKNRNKNCDLDKQINCHDVFRIHSLGHDGCNGSLNPVEEEKFESCLASSPNALIGLSTIG